MRNIAMAAPPSSSSNVVKVAPNVATVKPMKIPGGITTTTSSAQNTPSNPAMNKTAPQNGNTEGQYINGNLYQLAVVTIDGEKKRILIPAQSIKTLSGTPVLLCQKTDQGYRYMSVPSTTTTKTTNTPIQTGYSLINAPQQLTSAVFDASTSNLQKSVSRSLLPSFDTNKVNQGLASQSGSPNDVAATPVSVVNGSPSATLQGLTTISASDQLKDIASQVQMSVSPTVQLTQPTSTVNIANTSVPVASSSKFVGSNVTVVQPFMVSGANKNTAQPGVTSLTNIQNLQQQPILALISKEASAQPSIGPFPNATNIQPAVSSVTNAASVPQRVFIVPPVSCQKSGLNNMVTSVLPANLTTAASSTVRTVTLSDVAVGNNTTPAVLNLQSANNSQTNFSPGQQFQSSNGQSFVLVTRPTNSCVEQSQRTNTCVEAPDIRDQTSASNAPDTCQGALESPKPLFQIQDVYTLNSSNKSSEHVAKKTKRCSKDVANKRTESVSELDSEPETDPGSLDESEETISADTEFDCSEDAFKEEYNEDLKRDGDQVQATGKLQVLQTSQEDDTCSLNLDCEDVYDEDTEDGDLENEDDTMGKTSMLTTIENEASEMQSVSKSDASVSGAFERNTRNVIENIYLENNNELNESERASLSKVHGSSNEVAVDCMNKMKSCRVSLRRVVLPKNQSAFRTCEVERLSKSKGIGPPASKHMAVPQCSNTLGSGKSQVKLQKKKHDSVESKKHTIFQKVPVTTAALSNVKILTVNTDKTTDTEANQASLKATGPTPKAPADKEWERFIFFKLNGKAILVPINKNSVTMASSAGAKSIICRNGKYFFQGSPASMGKPEKSLVQNSSVEASTLTKYPAPTLPVAADRFDSKPNQCTTLAGTSHSALNIPYAEESNSPETSGQNLPTSYFKVKCEPTTYGYGDEVAPSTSTMNTVSSTGEQNQLSDISFKPVKTEPEDLYLVPNKIQKVEHGNGSVIQEFQSERIRKLKEKLRQQNEALEELRRKLKSKPSTAFECDDS